MLKMIQRNNENINYYIGDIEKDKAATEKAGLIFIHAKYGFDKNLKTKYFINNISDLPKLINKINEKDNI